MRLNATFGNGFVLLCYASPAPRPSREPGKGSKSGKSVISMKKSLSSKSLLALVALVAVAASARALINGNQPTVLTPANASGTFRGRTTAQARLSTLYGNRAVVGQPLELELVYANYVVRLGTYYTNASGVASANINLVPYDIPARGTYTLGWTYRGNGIYSVPVPTAILTVR